MEAIALHGAATLMIINRQAAGTTSPLRGELKTSMSIIVSIELAMYCMDAGESAGCRHEDPTTCSFHAALPAPNMMQFE